MQASFFALRWFVPREFLEAVRLCLCLPSRRSFRRQSRGSWNSNRVNQRILHSFAPANCSAGFRGRASCSSNAAFVPATALWIDFTQYRPSQGSSARFHEARSAAFRPTSLPVPPVSLGVLRAWLFFSFCNLRCVFCQNWDVSQLGEGREYRPEELADIMLDLQKLGCHNINLVTPEHVVPQVLEAIALAAQQGLRLPIVYNTSAYDSIESLRLVDGVVDVYMPDFKDWSPELARRYLKAADYPEVARESIREMHRQVGPLRFDRQGIARRGLLVRHLVMPGAEHEAREILRFLANEISRDTYVNLMDQYRPAGAVLDGKYPELQVRGLRPLRDQLAAEARGFGLWRFDERWR